MRKFRVPKLKLGRTISSLGKRLGKKENRPFIVVGGVLMLIVFASFFYAYSVYPGGWEAKNYFNYIDVNGKRFDGGATYINHVVNGYGKSDVRIDTSSGETSHFLSIGQDILVPAGSADVALTMGSVRHCIINPLTGELLETVDYRAHVEDGAINYVGSDGKPAVYYYEIHYYVFEITFRTYAETYDQGGTWGLGDVHEGNVAGSRGTPLSVSAYVSFEISPWAITTGYETYTQTQSNGSTSVGDYMSGFAGILGAKMLKVLGKGVVPVEGGAPDPNCGGYAKPAYGDNSKLNMYIDGSPVSQLNWKDPHIKGIPSIVDIEINSGDMLPDAYKHWYTSYWDILQPRDVYVQYEILVQVVQARNYVLRTGYQGQQGTPEDWMSRVSTFFDQFSFGFGSLFGGIIFFVLVIVGLYFLIKTGPALAKAISRKLGGKKR